MEPPAGSMLDVTIRAGMRNSLTGLSFIQTPQVNRNDQKDQRKKERRRTRLNNQGNCCWRLETNEGLRYRILADVLCALTLLPGSIVVILLSFRYIYNDEASPSEPYSWLKFVLAGSGCLLLVFYLIWAATGFWVYRAALKKVKTDQNSKSCEHAELMEVNAGKSAGNDGQDNSAQPGGSSASDDSQEDTSEQLRNNANSTARPLPRTLGRPIDIVVIPATPSDVEQQAAENERLIAGQKAS